MRVPYDKSEALEPDTIQARVEAKRVAKLQLVWSELLKLPDGQVLAWDIMDKAGLFRPSYSGNAHTNFLEGERNIALWLWGERIEPSGAAHLAEMMKAHQLAVDQFRFEVEAEMAREADERHED